MKRKVVFCFILVFLFFNCKTTDETYTTYDVSDYTEEDLIAEKIDEVKALIETDSIKALFLSWELNANVKDNSELNELFNSCKENVYDLYKKFYEEEKYLDCKRCIQSLESVGYKFENIDEINKNLSQKIYSNVLGLNNPGNKKASREVSDWIKGCVTIYVDKGIKVENGKGFVDAVIGSGFFISADGYIVTNYHVISDIVDKKNKEFSRLYIKLYYDSENRVPAKVIGWDSNLDLALIKTEAEVPYYFSLGSSTELKVGDKVYVIGSPLGLEKTLTSGIISSKERNLFSLGSVFQLDAAVNSGNSGGPVLDSNGKVQAVVFAGVPYYQGLNFAIPVEYLKSILPYLIQGDENKHPWICAYGKTLKNVVSAQEGLGVKLYYVLSKINNNPLSLKEDDVIIACNKNKISSVEDLKLCLMEHQFDSIVNFTCKDKNGQEIEKKVYLEKRPANPGYYFYKHDVVASALYPIVGMKLVNISTVSKRKYSITSIISGSTADNAGFSENDPVDLLSIDFDKEKKYAYIQMYAKKRKNGFLDIGITLPVELDGMYYL